MVASSKSRIAARQKETTSKQGPFKRERYDLQTLKGLLPEYLDKTGVEITHFDGRELIAYCPLHEDHKPSFRAALIDSVWLFYCHPCQQGGSVIDLHGLRHGVRPDGHDNLRELSELMGVVPLTDFIAPSKRTNAKGAATRRRLCHDAKSGTQTKLTKALDGKRESLLKPYLSDDWKADLWHSSPSIIEPDTLDQCRAMLTGLFQPLDLLWMGTPYESGKRENSRNFQSCQQWLDADSLPPRLAAGIFQAGSLSRSEQSITDRPYLVIESDELIGFKPKTTEERDENKKLSAALFAFMTDRLKMTLRAVIDTGGKSLHGWFDRPSPEGMTALQTIIDGLAIDTAVFARCSSNPLRAPGCLHDMTGNRAHLLHLSPLSY